MINRIFYTSGPGDIIESHRCWKRNVHNPTEVSVTFSSQIQDFCKEINAKAYFVSSHPRQEKLTDGDFTLEHRPKPVRHGARFHIAEVLYGLGLLATALRFRAQVIVADSGSTHCFVLTLFRLCGIRVIPVLHNSLWPNGFPPTRPIPRLVLWLDKPFWRWIPFAVIGVSPECNRQVEQVRGKATYPLLQTRAQFRPEHFKDILPPPSHDQRPFRMMYIGRVNRIKGVFDILEIARALEDDQPEMIRWELCGQGKDFDELTKRHHDLKLSGVVNLRGWTSQEDLVKVYSNSHASIVPTRSSFTEGLAMTAAEAILAGRPVVTNPVVPALEVLRDACVEAKTDDPNSHREAVLKLATDADLYRRACAACLQYQEQFYDRNHGLAQTLKTALARLL